MLDLAYINEIKEIGGKEAKDKLADYALTFGISVKRTKSFENMVLEFQEELTALASEPMPEQTEGLTISDLIQADDENEGKSVFVGEANETAKALLKGEETPKIEPKAEVVEIVVQKPAEVQEDEVVLVPEKERPVEVKIDPSFSPSVTLIGSAPGYANIPYWVYDFIEQNENWKDIIDTFKYKNEIKTLKSLVYYIQKHGSVQIRESRNSRFHILN